MRLEAFRVENYKRIHDTGWVTTRDLTVLVGKNESGKSAILRALSKLKPSDGENYDGLREFPRRRYTDEFDDQNWPVASVRLSLDDIDRASLTLVAHGFAATTEVLVTRHYSGRRTIGFEPSNSSSPVDPGTLRLTAERAKSAIAGAVAPDGKGEEMAALKAAVPPAIDAALLSVSGQGACSHAQVEGVVNAIRIQVNEAWQQAALAAAIEPLAVLEAKALAAAEWQVAADWVVANMPQFIYFDRYDVLDSAIHIPTFNGQLRANPHAPRVRTTHCLFRHVGLDIGLLARLGSHQPGTPEDAAVRRQIDERAIRSSSAGQAMTEKFAEWWQQRRHRFRYQSDGDYFRVWVSDDLDPSEIELDQRSQGMQYFFSFFLVFLVEKEDAHVNSILLLDEPGTSLHGTAQAMIVEFLNKTARDSQVIYTTHSPFMVDGEHLENAKAVWEDEETGTTRVSDDVWPKDRDALFPLQAALGYRIVQSMFISKRQVLVEGITDYWIAKALSEACVATGRQFLSPEVVLAPAGGAGRMLPLASMLVGHDLEIAALLDGDDTGRKEGRRLGERVIGETTRCVFVGDYLDNPTGEIEDLFPEDFYVAAVKSAYGSLDLRTSSEEKAIPNVADRMVAVFARKGHGDFLKWKVAAALRDLVLAEPASVPANTLDVAAQIFSRLNEVLDLG